VNETLMPSHVICGFEHFFFYPTECTLKSVLLPVYLFDLVFSLYENKHALCHCSYNAEKKKVGEYITTPIWSFRMKCHLCTNYIEIKTEPKVRNSTMLLRLATLSSSIKGFVISYQFTMMYASHGLHCRHMNYEQCSNLYSYFYIRI